MAEELLKAGERRKLQEALAKCASCGDLLQHMKSVGLDTEEFERRKEAVELLAKGMLEVDRMTQSPS